MFRDASGKQVCRSTGIEAHPKATTPKERARLAREARQNAEAVANEFERAARGELRGEAQIRKTILELAARAGNEVRRESAKDFFAAWLESSEKAAKSKTTLARYKQLSRDFMAHLGDRAGAPIETITSEEVEAFLDSLTAKGLATKTVANTLKILRIPFARAVRLGRMPTNPAAVAEAPAVVSVERKAFAPEELKLLLLATAEAPNGPEWRTAVMLGYYCGMRLGDATGLAWDCVDFQKGSITFLPEKTRKSAKKVEIPLHPSLAEYLENLPLPSGNPKALLTPTLATENRKRGWLSKQFGQLLRAAGIENTKERTTEEGGAGRTVSTKSFHALRHSLATHLANAGVSAEIRMKFTGHSSLAVHAGYSHLELSTLKEALEKLPK